MQGIYNHIISIHALREEGDPVMSYAAHADYISIHALREEGDVWPTLRIRQAARISIHALREEGDVGTPI